MSRVEELTVQYADLLHAMQSGVKFSQDKTDQKPKHLRVGVNAALVDHGAVVRLLIEKGVFTEEEYLEALVAGMQDEVTKYRLAIGKERGIDPPELG